MGIKDSVVCDFCGEVDYIEHFFYSCTHLKDFWLHIESTIFKQVGILVKLNINAILFGFDVDNLIIENRTINHILLIAKMSISKYKYGERINIKFIFDNELSLRIKNS